MSGLQQPISVGTHVGRRCRIPAGAKVGGEGFVVGLHVQKTCEDMNFVRTAVERGVERRPGATWAVFETDKEAQSILADHGVDPVLLPLVPAMKGQGYDVRRVWRERELMLADEVVVFQRQGASTTWTDRAKDKVAYGVHSHLYVVEVGKKKAKPRVKRGRAPVGA